MYGPGNEVREWHEPVYYSVCILNANPILCSNARFFFVWHKNGNEPVAWNAKRGVQLCAWGLGIGIQHSGSFLLPGFALLPHACWITWGMLPGCKTMKSSVMYSKLEWVTCVCLMNLCATQVYSLTDWMDHAGDSMGLGILLRRQGQDHPGAIPLLAVC